jgi:hypothetical protein
LRVSSLVDAAIVAIDVGCGGGVGGVRGGEFATFAIPPTSPFPSASESSAFELLSTADSCASSSFLRFRRSPLVVFCSGDEFVSEKKFQTLISGLSGV